MSSPTLITEKNAGNDVSRRLIGSVKGSEKGPAVIVLAGIHGNEPAGVEALQQVFDIVEALNPPFRGQFWGIRANLEALEQQVRFIDEDMNRIWFPSIIRKIKATPEKELASSERRELKKLLRLLDRLIPEDKSQPAIIADLHSFSAEGCMFTITAEKKEHIRLLSQLHAPMVFGIEDTLRGTLLRYYQERGHITFAFEGGEHQNKLTVYNETAALFLLLKQAGCIEADAVTQLSEFEQHLKEQTRYVPGQVSLVYQHIIEPGDDFEMRPGFLNFDPVKKGEWLATDNEGKIRAQCDGFVLMPLYQDQGNDGFFLVRHQYS